MQAAGSELAAQAAGRRQALRRREQRLHAKAGQALGQWLVERLVDLQTQLERPQPLLGEQLAENLRLLEDVLLRLDRRGAATW